MSHTEPGKAPDTLPNHTESGPALCVASFLVNAFMDRARRRAGEKQITSLLGVPGLVGVGRREEGGAGRRHLFDTLVSIRYLVCIFPGADYITACVDKHLESEQRELSRMLSGWWRGQEMRRKG